MTWDSGKFGGVSEFLHTLGDKGRSLVVIIDPHIKVDSYYFLYSDAVANGIYVLKF
jgi:alpha 1,3-glucosidase